MAYLDGNCPFKVVIFHSCVSLPQGNGSVSDVSGAKNCGSCFTSPIHLLEMKCPKDS